MNERIKLLAEQARQYAFAKVENSQDPTEWSSKYYNEMFDDKFAELIVQECIRYFNEDYQRDFDTLWREDLSKSIKEHFGVEE